MLVIKTSISELVSYVNLWNKEYSLALKFGGQYGKYTAWTVGNVLITGTEITPNTVLCEFDNFDLRGRDVDAKGAIQRLSELLHASFFIDNTFRASQAYSIMDREATRTLRVIPAIFADTALDARTEADFKTHAREKNPYITEEELTKSWQSFSQYVEQQKAERQEQQQRRIMTAEDAIDRWRKGLVEERAFSVQQAEDKATIVAQEKDNTKVVVQSAWANGSFYLFTFMIIIFTLGVLANNVPSYTLALIIVAAILFVPLIGVLQLRQDDRISEKNFIELLKLVVAQLPLIGKMARKNLSDK